MSAYDEYLLEQAVWHIVNHASPDYSNTAASLFVEIANHGYLDLPTVEQLRAAMVIGVLRGLFYWDPWCVPGEEPRIRRKRGSSVRGEKSENGIMCAMRIT